MSDHKPHVDDVKPDDTPALDDVDVPESESESPLGWIVYVDPVDGTRKRVTVEHYRTLNL